MSETAANDPDALEALPPGAAIGGYAVRRMIGHGGFGITYEAHNRVTGKEVAIKEFFPSSMVRRDGNSRLIYSKVNSETIAWALRKFEETTTTLCGLEHPNIVRVHDYVPANDTGYMIMELVDGETLEHWLKSRAKPPSVEELQPFVDPVMEALAYVHGRGLIHRDIAPDNILITRSGRPVLIDFGSVSRDLSDARQKAMSGTVGLTKRHYTAPEQMLSKARPTPEADIYSMGAVLYRALSGEKPADGQDRIDAVFRSQPDPYRPLAGRRDLGCPAQVAQAVDRALAVRAEGRLHRIADLRAALMLPAAAKPRLPRTWVAAAAALVVLAALGGGAAGLWMGGSGTRQPDVDLARQRGEVAAAKADVARQRDDVQAAKADLVRQRGELAAAKADADRQRDDAQTAKADVDRERGELEGVRANLDRQRGALDTAKADLDRQKGSVDDGRADLDRQRGDLGAAKTEVANLMGTLGDAYYAATTQNYAKALQYYERAAAFGNAAAMVRAGFIYDRGLGVARDNDKARGWYEKAAALGNVNGLYNLGVFYEEGRGVAKDYDKAREWFEKASAAGKTEALTHIGHFYEKGFGVTQDYDKARDYYEKAAAAGESWAMYDLGIFYELGHGVAQDYDKARDYYEKGAAAGNALAMRNLGALYYNGKGVAKDFGVARDWFEKGAQKGDANAMSWLGFLYEKGYGVTADRGVARQWYEKAAQGGDGFAKTALGRL